MSRSSIRRFGRRLVAVAAVVIVLTAGSVFAVNLQFDRTVDDIRRVDVSGLSTRAGSARNFLLVGSDTREFVGDDPAAQESFGAPGGGNRSDTIMIVHAHADGGFVVSFPRDLWVDVPGVGGAKINAAFNDGPSKVVETIEANFDVPIHHFLEVDFASFAGLVDALGGVPVYFPAPARDTVSGLDVPEAPGCVVLDGDQALAYVRSRSYQELVDGTWVEDATADIGRIGRQQTFMRRLTAETIQTATAEPFRAPAIADASLEFLTADTALEPDDMRALLGAFRGVDPDDPESLEMITMPWETGPSQGGQSVLYLSQPGADDVLARLRDPGTAPTPSGPTVEPSTVRVRVLNGTETTGLAASTVDALAAEGFVPAGTGDNPEKPVGATEVRSRPGGEAAARTVQQHLGGVGSPVEDDSIVDADVVVVLGTDFGAVEGAATPAGVPASGGRPAIVTARSVAVAGDPVAQAAEPGC